MNKAFVLTSFFCPCAFKPHGHCASGNSASNSYSHSDEEVKLNLRQVSIRILTLLVLWELENFTLVVNLLVCLSASRVQLSTAFAMLVYRATQGYNFLRRWQRRYTIAQVLIRFAVNQIRDWIKHISKSQCSVRIHSTVLSVYLFMIS